MAEKKPYHNKDLGVGEKKVRQSEEKYNFMLPS